MMEIHLPTTRMVVTRRAEQNKNEIAYEVMEQEVPMDPAQQDAYAAIVGDGNAHVTVSREVSHSNFGTGGKVFVSITLTCHQDQQHLAAAANYAASLADHYAEQHWSEWSKKLPQILSSRMP